MRELIGRSLHQIVEGGVLTRRTLDYLKTVE
jgi:hypothetical protein